MPAPAAPITPERQPVLVAGVRTPFLNSGGAYADLRAYELAAAPLRALRERCDLGPEQAELVTMGMVVQDVNTTNVAREAMLSAGFSSRVPAYTVSMAGVSPNVGLAHVCDQIALGRLDCAVAAGAEQFSDLPIRMSRNVRKRAVRLALARSLRQRLKLLAGLRPRDLVPELPSAEDLTTGMTMGQCCEAMAERFGVTREQADAFALRSHRQADEAWAQGRYDEDVMPMACGGQRVERDDAIRSDTSMEKLAALKPSFADNGVVTAGNASGLTDGAGALLLMSAEAASRAGRQPLLRVVDYQFTGVQDMASEMLLGPANAIPPLLQRHGLQMQDIAVFELHEAFAAQILANQAALVSDEFACEELGLDAAPGAIPSERLNNWGGSLALGNPFAGTGIRLVLTAARRLQAEGGRYAVVATCAGGGLGAALLLENPAC